ncbi:MAG: TolC family protein [Elusimicrobia bacterium]|nr:TolC family protein [Elusimicrobiota bacterium]
MRLSRALAALLAASLLAGPARAQAPDQPTPGSPERVYTLDDALRLIRNDPQLQSAQQDVIIADSRVTESELRFLPDMGLQASASKFHSIYPFSLSQDFRNILLFPNTPENIYSSRAYFNLPLYEGQRTLNTYRLASAAQKQALARRDSVKMDLTLQVKEAFYGLLFAQEKDSESSAELAAVKRYAAEVKPGAWQAIEAEGAADEAAARASQAAHDLQAARLAFLKSLNLELDTPFRVQGTLKTEPVKIPVERAVLWAMELRPELQSQTYKAQMDAIGVHLAMGRRYPTVYLAGDYELTAQSFPLDKNNWDLTIGVKLPFTYDLWSQLQQKRAEQRQGQLTRSELQDKVRLEVHRAAASLDYWQQEFPRREAQWKRLQELYDAAKDKPGTPLDKIRARESLLDLRLSYLTAVTQHLLARARLARAVGREIAP